MRLSHAVLQIRLARAIVRAERLRGGATPEMIQRATEVVERGAIAIEAQADEELLRLLSSAREELSMPPD